MPVRLPFCPDGPAGTGQGTWKFPDFFFGFFFLVSSRVCFVCVLNWSWPPSHPFQVRLVVLCSVTQVVCPPPLGDSPRDWRTRRSLSAMMAAVPASLSPKRRAALSVLASRASPLSLRPFAPAHCISAWCHPVRPSGVLVLQLAQGTAAVAHLFIFIFLAFISTLPRPSQFSNGQQKTRKKMSDSIFSSPFFSRNDVIYPVPSWPSAQHAPTLIFSRTLQRPPPLPSCVILHLFLLAHK